MAIQQCQLNHLYTSTLRQKQLQRKLPFFFTISPPPKLLHIRASSSSRSSARQLIESGTVRPILPKDAASALNSEGFILLDIRPAWEREKARVSGSVHVPLFVKDMDNSPITLLKKWVHFGYIGLWTGQSFTMINSDFVNQVQIAVPDKDSKLLVACGEGLR